MSEQPEPFNVDMLYLEAEHFALLAESRPPLEPGKRIVPIGRPYAGLFPREDGAGPVRPDEEPAPMSSALPDEDPCAEGCIYCEGGCGECINCHGCECDPGEEPAP